MSAEPNNATPNRRIKPRILSGFRDFLPQQAMLRQRVIGLFRDIFERHGYEPIDTPVLEYLDVLTGKAGENERLMYHFLDQGERQVGMRYDLTVPLARVMAMYQNDLVLPFKRYHIAPVWRADRPQRGRFREFWQCDADIAGSASMLADAEGIAILDEAVSALGINAYTIRINHRHLLSAMVEAASGPNVDVAAVIRTIDGLDKVGPNRVESLLIDDSLTPTGAARLMALLTDRGDAATILARLEAELPRRERTDGAIADLRALFGYLGSLGVPASRAILDLSLARGLDYYTGPVVEVSVERPSVGSIAGGGRYDGLIGAFSSRPMPATGISIGIERVIEVVSEFNLLTVPKTTAEVFVVVFPEDVADAAQLANRFRSAGLEADLSLLGERSIGEQLRYGGRRGIPVAAIRGPDERRDDQITIKELTSGEQQTIPSRDAIDCVRSSLAAIAGAGITRE